MRSILTGLVILVVLMVGVALANAPALDISENWNLQHWQRKVFANDTQYTVVDVDAQKVLKASTDNSASVLYKKIDIDLSATPYLNWSWRVENTFSDLDPRQKQGDDFPARVYVVYKDGFLPWQALSLNYVWANQAPDAAYWPNPFTERAMMIPVDSGDQGLGQWHHYKKDIRADFQRVFDKDITQLHGVAIMADSDNSMQKAVSYFGDIHFSAE